MSFISPVRNLYYQRMVPFTTELRKKINRLTEETLPPLDEFQSDMQNLRTLFGKVQETSQRIFALLDPLEQQSTLNLENRREIAYLRVLIHDDLQLGNQIEQVNQKILFYFEESKKGARLRQVEALHPRCFYPAPNIDPSSLRMVPENQILRFPVGIENRGNNCWGISIMQLLFNIPTLRRYILFQLPEEFSELKGLARQYFKNQLQNESYPGTQAVSEIQSMDFRNLLARNFPGVFSENPTVQSDAYESLLFILGQVPHQDQNPFFTEMTTSRKYDVPRDHPLRPLLGTSVCDLDMHGCSKSKTREFQIFLDLENQNDVTFIHLVQRSMLNTVGEPGRYLHYSLQFAEEKRTFKQPPQNLIFVAKRFTFGIDGTSQKIYTPVSFPENYVLPSQYTENGQTSLYELKGFIQHIGTPTEGHYISFIHLDVDGGKWVLCDDSHIRFVSPENLRSALNRCYIAYYGFKRTIAEQEAQTIISAYPRNEPLPPPVSNTSTLSAIAAEYKRKDFLRRALDSIQKSQDPAEINRLFSSLPIQIKKLFYTLKLVNDGMPESPQNYGQIEVEKNPSCLKQITKTWLYDGQNLSILQQYMLGLDHELHILLLKRDIQFLFALNMMQNPAEGNLLKFTQFVQNQLAQRFPGKNPSEIIQSLKMNVVPMQLLIRKRIDRTQLTLHLCKLTAIKNLLQDPTLQNNQLQFILFELDDSIIDNLLNAICRAFDIPMIHKDIEALPILIQNFRILEESPAGIKLIDQVIQLYLRQLSNN